MKLDLCLMGAAAVCMAASADALEFEVVHWWTTQTESAAVRTLAEAWTATGHSWIDGALAGEDACALMVNRVVGGDPMDACVPINIHSLQRMWLSNAAFNDAGLPVPTNWDEFVARADALRAAGKLPMAMGGQP